MRWTPALHASFSAAVAQLGGPSAATAAGVLSIMTTAGCHSPGLTLHSVGLHLEVRCKERLRGLPGRLGARADAAGLASLATLTPPPRTLLALQKLRDNAQVAGKGAGGDGGCIDAALLRLEGSSQGSMQEEHQLGQEALQQLLCQEKRVSAARLRPPARLCMIGAAGRRGSLRQLALGVAYVAGCCWCTAPQGH
jgi:hypothetical protein